MTPEPEETISEASFQPGSRSRTDLSMPANSAVELLPMKPADAPSKGSQPFRRVVQKGETLMHISLDVYGASDPDTLKWIVAWNPQIQDINWVMEGDLLILPERPDARGKTKVPR